MFESITSMNHHFSTVARSGCIVRIQFYYLNQYRWTPDQIFQIFLTEVSDQLFKSLSREGLFNNLIEPVSSGSRDMVLVHDFL